MGQVQRRGPNHEGVARAQGHLGAIVALVAPDDRVNHLHFTLIAHEETATEPGAVTEAAEDVVAGNRAVGERQAGREVHGQAGAVAARAVLHNQTVLDQRVKGIRILIVARDIEAATGSTGPVVAEDTAQHIDGRPHPVKRATLPHDHAGVEVFHHDDRPTARGIRVPGGIGNDLHRDYKLGPVAGEGRIGDRAVGIIGIDTAAVEGIGIGDGGIPQDQSRVTQVEGASNRGRAAGDVGVDNRECAVLLHCNGPAIAQVDIVRQIGIERDIGVGDATRIETGVRHAILDVAVFEGDLAVVDRVDGPAVVWNVQVPIGRAPIGCRRMVSADA